MLATTTSAATIVTLGSKQPLKPVKIVDHPPLPARLLNFRLPFFQACQVLAWIHIVRTTFSAMMSNPSRSNSISRM